MWYFSAYYFFFATPKTARLKSVIVWNWDWMSSDTLSVCPKAKQTQSESLIFQFSLIITKITGFLFIHLFFQLWLLLPLFGTTLSHLCFYHCLLWMRLFFAVPKKRILAASISWGERKREIENLSLISARRTRLSTVSFSTFDCFFCSSSSSFYFACFICFLCCCRTSIESATLAARLQNILLVC